MYSWNLYQQSPHTNSLWPTLDSSIFDHTKSFRVEVFCHTVELSFFFWFVRYFSPPTFFAFTKMTTNHNHKPLAPSSRRSSSSPGEEFSPQPFRLSSGSSSSSSSSSSSPSTSRHDGDHPRPSLLSQHQVSSLIQAALDLVSADDFDEYPTFFEHTTKNNDDPTSQ